ncbi:GYD domain-containing protein [Haloferula sp.]|uniref:GYD domain-containing protein n=1 Tax=Haloferula sp. TaxID=2497595 RepID=UPI003C7566D9
MHEFRFPDALYWTTGPYDGLISFDAPDEETVDALMLELNSSGRVRTQTMRALDRAAFSVVLDKAKKG